MPSCRLIFPLIAHIAFQRSCARTLEVAARQRRNSARQHTQSADHNVVFPLSGRRERWIRELEPCPPPEPRRFRNSTRRRRRSPSEPLVNALRKTGKLHALPDIKHISHKVDLSYVNARTATQEQWQRALARRTGLEGAEEERPTLQRVLAKHILERQEEALAGDINTIVDKEDMRYLESKGYRANDLRSWSYVVCTKDDGAASQRLLAHISGPLKVSEDGTRSLPTFVWLFFLRRHYISPNALRNVLVYAWHELHQMLSDTQPVHALDKSTINPSSMLIAIFRLLRHARTVWPEALVSITKMFMQYMAAQPIANRRGRARESHTTDLFNRFLALLAVPSSMTPYHSVAYQQRAQFDLLQGMAEHQPPVLVTREGYMAIVSIQLANKKTARERDWDSLKAKSWPPWKEDRTGLDEEKDRVYGSSRALQVMNRMRQAGYGPSTASARVRTSDHVARILAGWDIDGSPTIQTRALLFHIYVSDKYLRRTAWHEKVLTGWSVSLDESSKSPEVWAARIRATRTVQEAWACFLAYGEASKSRALMPYIAMLEKLASERKRLNETTKEPRRIGLIEDDDTPILSSGDSRELRAAPQSPKYATYVHTQPPSYDELAAEMLQRGIVPSGPWLGFLMSNAGSLREGLQYANVARVHTPNIAALFGLSPRDDHVREVSAPLFSAFISLLCRFPLEDLVHVRDNVNAAKDSTLSVPWPSLAPLILAFRLLRARKTVHRAPWLSVLKVLAEQRVIVYLGSAIGETWQGRPAHFLNRWSLMQDVVAEMKHVGLTPDGETLHIMCRGLESGIFAALDIEAGHDLETNSKSDDKKPLDEFDLAVRAVELLQSGATNIRKTFHDVMGTSQPSPSSTDLYDADKGRHVTTPTPKLLTIPRAPTIHAYVRVLGLLRDWPGMVDFVKWMVEHEKEIAAGIDMPRNGPRLLRRTIVALRVFLERSWADSEVGVGSGHEGSTDEDPYGSAPRHMVETVKTLVNSVHAWKGWPSDEEVESYCAAGRFPGSG